MKKKIKSSTKTGARGYVKYPGTKWKEVQISWYKNLQILIGGFFQIVPIAEKLTLYCDDEGKLKNLESNLMWLDGEDVIDVLVGPVVLLGPVDREGSDTDATLETLKLLEKHCAPI